jgi:hypothetical protein
VLTVTSVQARYQTGAAITIDASLEYSGPDASIEIAHDSEGLVSFGVVEPVNGMQLSPVSDLTCGRTTLQRGTAISVPFRKSGGAIDAPDPSAVVAYFGDPVLHLPPGTWDIYAEADLQVPSCGGIEPERKLRATVRVEVAGPNGAVPPATTPSPPPQPGDLPVGDDTQEGAIQLTLTSPHGRWQAGQPITVVAGLDQGDDGTGRGPITTYGSSGGPVAFDLQQLDGPISIQGTLAADCGRQLTLPMFDPHQIPFVKSGAIPSGLPGAAYWQAWFADPVLRLPAGTWKITARTVFDLTPDCKTPGPDLEPTITIVVTP